MSNERPAVLAAINRPGAVLVAPADTGTALIELPELPQRLAPSIAQAAGERMYADAVEIEETAIPIPESAPRWAHEDATFSDEAGSGFTGGVGPRAGGGRGRKASARGFPWAGRRLRAALLTGALLSIFALGWAGGVTWTKLLAPAPPVSPLKQRLDASARAAGRPRVDASRAATAGSNVRKLSSTPSTTLPDPAPIALQNGVRDLPHLLPVPDTKPTTVEGWTVRDVSGGFASLEGPQGTWRVARGDIVPGLGRVESIVRWGGYWLVSTNRGLVASE
jgi:hypothetical protein